MKARRPSETDLGRAIVPWLEERGWDVYQEVKLAGPIADIVAVQDRLVWVIELKAALTFAVVAQARYWRRFAHFIAVAVPTTERCDEGRRFAYDVLEWQGVGLFTVNRYGHVRHDFSGAVNRSANAKRLRDTLRPEHKTFAAAGTASGARWSEFQSTCDGLRRLVSEKPGITLKEAIEETRHHYRCNATARSCLARWIRSGVVNGITLREEGRCLRLWPEGKP